MLKNTKLLAVAFVYAACHVGAAVADSDVINLPSVTDESVAPKSCEEAKREAEFLRELSRTDGDYNPQIPEVPQCAADDSTK